jgi:PBSX family phage terminase large subunit
MTQPLKVVIPKRAFLPCYHHLLEGNYDIELLWGGRDSGKSRQLAMQLVIECMSAKYFRCILAKKTFESIKDAQWQTIKDVCEEWGIAHLFTFTVAPLSITCINGNKFIARGFDKADKVKSISNPSHAWVEEADQLSQGDYITLSTTLRRNDGQRVKQVLSFNPETKGDRDEFWIYKQFFGNPDKRNFTGEYQLKDAKGVVHTYKYRSTHTTYHDNPFCSADRQSVLENLKIIDPYYYQVYTLGEWGQRQVQRPFITALRSEHVTRNPVFDPVKPVYVAMDFNIDPFAFIFAHHWQDRNGEHLHIFDEATIYNGSIHAAVEYLNANYKQVIHKMIFTGDPGGNRREFSQRDNASLYTTLQRGLRLRPNQLIVPAAPTHKNSREEVNYFLHHFPDFKVHEERCKNLVFDMKFVEVDEHGSIVKKNREKTEQKADHMDAVRYLINTFFKKWIYLHQKRR